MSVSIPSYLFIIGCLMLVLGGCQPSSPSDLGSTPLPDHPDFNLHIRPILSDRCYACHGPDANSREANLRLDTEEGAFAALDSLSKRFAIVPKRPGKSEVIHRITSDDPELVMPPPASNLTLSQREIQLLTRWIEQGATWKPHWSFIPPQKAAVPKIDHQADWANNEIDPFVRAKMREQGLTPAPQADPELLLRRVSFALTGLPPTPEEIDQFLEDPSPHAYEHAVDRLLASPHFGEHMAVDWLDLSRYADTHGYQADYYRPHWPWRDWVIDAFNENMPLDEFITWQLAGDLMPNPTHNQILATGFNRNHAQNAEGGIVQEEFRVEYVADRTQTFATAFLGLTMQCARCHDHKYDPISQQEFYELFHFFNQVDEAGQITWNKTDMPGPTLHLPSDSAQQQLEWLQEQIQQAEHKLTQSTQAQLPAFQKWLSRASHQLPQVPKGRVAYYPLEQVTKKRIPNLQRSQYPGNILNPTTNRQGEDPLIPVAGVNGQGLQLSGDDALAFPQIGRYGMGEDFSVGLWVHLPDTLEEGVIFHSNKGAAIYTFKGYQVSVEGEVFDIRLAHDFPHNAIHLTTGPVPKSQWIHLMLSYDGSGKAKGVQFYLNGTAQKLEVHRDNLRKDMVFHPRKPGGNYIDTYLKVGARWRSRGIRGAKVDEIMVFDRALSPPEIAHLAGKQQDSMLPEQSAIADLQQHPWFSYFLAMEGEKYNRQYDQVEQLRLSYAQELDTVPELMVMDERREKRPTYILARGAYDAPAEEVGAATPRQVMEFTEQFPSNRLGLAQWLFDPDNPLPARVMVNRYWQRLFGSGLVSTLEDFGSQGELPTHPELLDWLAVEFMESGWDLKHLLKYMVLSATYQQDSRPTHIQLETDPDNRWLSLGPRSRLSAESLRDQALVASGLLVRKLGGPPVKPYQPKGLWAVNRMFGPYQQDHGEDLYRRSMYTFWRRTNPPPSMRTFDAPSRSYCVVQRQKTSTPLQALVLMNDPQFLEAARVLGQRVVQRYPNDIIARITWTFRSLTGRKPRPSEIELFQELYAEGKAQYQVHPEPESLLAIGEYPIDPDVDPSEVFASYLIASTIMNMDASVTQQ